MRAPADLEGLPWPDGDPAAMRDTATAANGLAEQLEGHVMTLVGIDHPAGWAGLAAGSFSGIVDAHSADARRHASACRHAAGALSHLASVVDHAQSTVARLARELHDARHEATVALQIASAAREVAQEAHAAATAVTSTGAFAPIVDTGAHAAQARAADAEQQAQGLEARAAVAVTHRDEVERRATRDAADAVHTVDTADQQVAGELDNLGLIGPGAPSSTPPSGGSANPHDPMSALGQLLFGGTAGSRASIVALLHGNPPPPPPPKPKQAHHGSWLKVGLMAAATAAMTGVDAAQLGLDPVTDAATAGLAGATAAEAAEAAGGAEAAAGEAAAGEAGAASAAGAAEDGPLAGGANESLATIDTAIDEGTTISGRFPRTAGADELVVRRDPQTGQPTNYQVYDSEGLPVKRVDLEGRTHGGVPTPHVVEYERHVNPETGETFVRPANQVRPARPDEVPGG